MDAIPFTARQIGFLNCGFHCVISMYHKSYTDGHSSDPTYWYLLYAQSILLFSSPIEKTEGTPKYSCRLPPVGKSSNRVTEFFRLAQRPQNANINPTLPCSPLNHIPKCHIYTSWILPGMATPALPWAAWPNIWPFLSVKNFFLTPKINLFWNNLKPFPLFQSLATWEKRLILTSYCLFSGSWCPLIRPFLEE